MALTKFKTFLEQAPAPGKDYVPAKDGDEEVKGMEPRSKGERDFKAKHTVKKVGHPAAADKQFKVEEVEQIDEVEAMGRADFKMTPSGRKVRKLVRFKNASDADEKGEE